MKKAQVPKWSKGTVELALLLVAALVPLAAAALLTAARSHVQNTSLALIMVAVVVAIATPGRRLAALIAGVSAGLWFDFFLTKPYGSFAIHRTSDLDTTILLTVVALAVGEISARRRRQQHWASVTRDDLERVHVIAGMLAEGDPTAEILPAVAGELAALLGLLSCRFDPSLSKPSGPWLDHSGLLNYGHLAWDLQKDGLPNKDVSLLIEVGGQPVGRFVMRGPELGVPIPAERLTVAITLAQLAGAALQARHTADR
jgi:hypothetical protein